MTECKICGDKDALDGTKLCNGCWEATRQMENLARRTNVDMQITYEALWTVDVRDQYGQCHRGESVDLADAIALALELSKCAVDPRT